MKNCKHCKSPLYDDGSALRLLTPSTQRELLLAAKWDGEVRGMDFFLVSRMRDLGLIAEMPKYSPKERAQLRKKWTTQVRRAAKLDFAQARKLLQDDWKTAYKAEQKETRLTALGWAMAKRLHRALEKVAP